MQRYGWDRAAEHYERCWWKQLAPAQERLLALAALSAGERVLDVACDTGLVTIPAVAAVGPHGEVVGSDISERMVEAAREEAARRGVRATFERMDAEDLTCADDARRAAGGAKIGTNSCCLADPSEVGRWLCVTPSGLRGRVSSAPDLQAGASEGSMKKSNHKTVRRRFEREQDTMQREYDFSRAKRGVTAARYAQGSNIVVLDPDVAAVFPNASAVNEALRSLARVARRTTGAERRRRTA